MWGEFSCRSHGDSDLGHQGALQHTIMQLTLPQIPSFSDGRRPVTADSDDQQGILAIVKNSDDREEPV